MNLTATQDENELLEAFRALSAKTKETILFFVQNQAVREDVGRERAIAMPGGFAPGRA